MSGILIALATGLVGTTVIHLSKGVMKLGSVLLRDPSCDRKKVQRIYAVGIAMNFTNPVWVIIANRFAPTVYYTSMYGLGLLSLLLFSHFVLHEKLHRRALTGAGIVVAGTLLLGLDRVYNPLPGMYMADRTIVLGIAVGWLILAPLILSLMHKTPLSLQEMTFGIVGGGMAALEALVKGIAQAGPEGSSFIPQSSTGWLLFLLSFLGAVGAFLIIQWSYLRRCRVANMAAAFDISYIALPILITVWAFPGQRLSLIAAAGLVILSAGTLIMQTPPAVKKNRSVSENR